MTKYSVNLVQRPLHLKDHPIETVGWTSILPPLLAIGLAIATRRVYLSLASFIVLGWTILNGWNPLTGLLDGAAVAAAAIVQPANFRTLLFSAMIGAIIALTQVSGGTVGLTRWVESRLPDSRRGVSMGAIGLSMMLFLESNFGLLVTGTVTRPLVDRARISREKLAYLLDATCAPKQLLIPINAWGAYISALLLAQGVERPNELLFASLGGNVYSWVTIALAVVVALTGFDIGPMRRAEERVRHGHGLLRPGARPMISEAVASLPPNEAAPPRARNLVLPIGTMVVVVPLALRWTGQGSMMQGDGSTAVLMGVTCGVAVALLLYRAQGILTLPEALGHAGRGMVGLLPVVMVLALAFGIAETQQALGTGVWLSSAATGVVAPAMIPAATFLIAAIAAFSTGTSWGTFAIMIPIVVPVAAATMLPPGLVLGAALGGGIFGDHCSPISDSTIVASMAAATDHVDHVNTQLPYALVAAGISLVLLLVLGVRVA